MEQMDNRLTLPTNPNRQSEMMVLVTTSYPLTGPKGKRKVGQAPMVATTFVGPLAKKLKAFKDPFLQIFYYPNPTMETIVGEQVDIEKTLLEHYGSLKL